MTERKRIFVWSLYDFANTSYSIVVVTFLYAVYFKKVVAQGQPIGDLYWSIGMSSAMLITAFLSPILGAISDYSAGKKKFLLFFTILCIVFTSLLYFVQTGNIFWGLIFFIFANIGFEAGLTFYDAFLPELTEPKNFGRVSGYGFAMGYFGSLCILFITLPFIQNEMLRETFPIAALFYLIFSLPLFLFLKEEKKPKVKGINFVKLGLGRVYNTLTHLKDYKNLATFILAYFFFIEGVNTIIYFSGNYASTTIGFTEEDLLIFFIIVQTTALIGSILFGILADKIGLKITLMISLGIWLCTTFMAYISVEKLTFYIVGTLAGFALGSSQSTSRSLMSKLTPYEKRTEFFGFYSFFGKSSAILGPMIFGLVSYGTGSQRIAILTIAFFFIVGMLILTQVKEPPAVEKPT